jgi:hypothetical protein
VFAVVDELGNGAHKSIVPQIKLFQMEAHHVAKVIGNLASKPIGRQVQDAQVLEAIVIIVVVIVNIATKRQRSHQVGRGHDQVLEFVKGLKQKGRNGAAHLIVLQIQFGQTLELFQFGNKAEF